MRITDHIDLFYPSGDAKRYAAERRRKIRESGTRFAEDLQLDIIKKIVCLSGSERFIALAEELSDDIETIQYRLDCLEDFLNNPDLAQSFHRIFSEFSERRSDDEEADEVDSFYDIKDKMDELSGFLGTIEEINKLYKRTGRSIRSKAVRGLFDFFAELPEKEEYKSISESLDELNKTFSKTIRSVKIGVNFVGNMIPDSAGIIEVSYDKIYPKGNILERMVFGDTKGKEKFSGEEHLNSLTHRTPVDIDTALFRELSEYTREYADRIAAALKNYRLSFFSDLSELIRQLDFYDSAAAFVKSVRSRGLPMCRPKLLPYDQRSMKLKGTFDFSFYRQLAGEDRRALLSERIVTNDIELDDKARFYMVTGANNGGKTTFVRAVGVCQILAQAGFFVPAEECEISVCDCIYTHFPKEEQKGIDSSKFTSEIKQFKTIIDNITENSLLLMNESIQSTTPTECVDIASRLVELFAGKGVRGIFATHLIDLAMKVDELNKKAVCGSVLNSIVSTVDENGERSYVIKEGKPMKNSFAENVLREFGIKL